METSNVYSNGQLTIPVRIRKKLGIKKGTKIAFIADGNKLLFQPLNKQYFENLAGILDLKGKMLKLLMKGKKREIHLNKYFRF